MSIDPGISKLADYFEKEALVPNRMTYDTFKEFWPIFTQVDDPNALDQDTLDKLVKLSTKYYGLIDPYKEVEIIDTAGNVIITLPRRFTQVKQLPNTRETEVLVSTNANLASSGAPPRYKAEAFGVLMTRLVEEQGNNSKIIQEARDAYQNTMRQWNTAYGKSNEIEDTQVMYIPDDATFD